MKNDLAKRPTGRIAVAIDILTIGQWAAPTLRATCPGGGRQVALYERFELLN